MRKITSEPPTLWQIPDIVGVLLLPIALLFILVDAIALRGVVYGRKSSCPQKP